MGTPDLSAVGDHFLIGLQPSPTLTDKDKRLLGAVRPAGVVLFKGNFAQDLPYDDWLAAHARLIEDVRAVVGRERMLISVDHEGGRVVRTPPPITRFAYARHWAGEAAAVGRAMGIELASLGFNLDFAPCVDIHSNPENPVIGPRAFGTTPEAVIGPATAFLDALQAEGVIGCAKHFPGHGDTATDSHYGLPRVDHDAEALAARELKPFAGLIAAGVPVVMTSHILFPKIDPDWPATLSRRIVTGLLRERLGFQGVVVTDDIGMRAMTRFFDDPTAAARCFAAGTDMLTVCAHWTDTERALGFAEALLAARRSGAIPEADFAASSARVAALLARTQRHPVRRLPDAVFAAHARVAALHESDTSANTV